MLWVATTLVASVAQTARNAMQSSLTSALGTLGATQVRFLYGFPFAALFLCAAAFAARSPVPQPTGAFFAFTAAGALAQIVATALMLAAMRDRAFSVAIAFTKTEALQVALFGVAVLGDALTVARVAAIAIASAGVLVIASEPARGARGGAFRPALYGMASGAFFAMSAVGFRGAILALPEGAYFMRAATALAWSLGLQAALLGAWMAAFDRSSLLRSFALWRQSLAAGFMGAFASELWFLGFSLTAAANVRTLALVEVLLAQGVSKRVFGQRLAAREAVGIALLLVGVAMLLLAA